MSLATSDAIYIGSDFPLNHLYVKMGAVVNDINSVIAIHYWDGSNWISAVNVNDYTYAFSQSGFIEFTPDRDEQWLMESTNSSGQFVTDLQTVTVYDKYWLRITVSVTLKNNVELQWIGNKFSEDEDLFAEYPIFNDSTFLTSFETGKTSWEEQHIKAADLIIQDMKRKNIILGSEQILDRDILTPASVAKVAEIIFNAFGSDYVEQRQHAKEEYSRRIDLSKYGVDTNNNAIVDAADVRYSQGWLSR
jgi:hypothetical protein